MENADQQNESTVVSADPISLAKLEILMPRLHYILLFFGVLLVFITPPLQTPDEDSHLVRAAMVSEGNFLARYDGERWGQDVPASLVAYVEHHRPMRNNESERYSYWDWYAYSHALTPGEPTVLHSYSAQSSSPLFYIPQAAGIWVGKVLYAVSPGVYNWAAAQYFARLGNLVFFVLVICFAVRIAPEFGCAIAFLAMTPMAICVAASASYDATVIAVAVAYFATIVAAMRSTSIGPKHWIAIFALAFLLGHSKMVYAPVLLTLFVFISRLGWKNFLKMASVAGIAALFGALIVAVVFGVPSSPAVDAAIQGQIGYLNENPLAVPALVVNTLLQAKDFYYISALGNLGYLNANFPLPLLTAWFGVGLAAIVADMPVVRRRIDLLFAAYSFGGIIISVALLMLVMYIIWTSQTVGIGAPHADGVQGRYLLPLFPFAFAMASILLSTFVPVRQGITLAITRHQLLAGAIMLSLTVFMLIVRYWVPLPTL